MAKELPDSEIVAVLLDNLNITAAELSTSIGAHKNSFYGILQGRRNLTAGLRDRLIATYPNLNNDFLIKGTLPVIKSADHGFMSLLSMPERLQLMEANQKRMEDNQKRIEEKLDQILKFVTNQ